MPPFPVPAIGDTQSHMQFLPLSHLLTAVTPKQAAELVLLRLYLRDAATQHLAAHNVPPAYVLPLIGAGVWDNLENSLHAA